MRTNEKSRKGTAFFLYDQIFWQKNAKFREKGNFVTTKLQKCPKICRNERILAICMSKCKYFLL